MAKIKSVLTTQEIVKNNVNTYIKDATKDYPNFLETAPYFVTYYSRSLYQSTFDTSFEIYNEIAGEESPNKFHKIENLPVYSLDVSDFGSELTDEGWKKEVSSSCIILPDTVVPKPDDLIEIEIHSKKYLFQVVNGSSDNYGNSKFYKIVFRLSQYTTTEADKQTTEEFEIDFDNIGKKKNVLLKKNYLRALEKIESIYDELLEVYVYKFFDTQAQSFTLKELGILDQYLNYFIDKNKLNKPFLEFRNSIIISPLIKKYLVMSMYETTPYSKLQKNIVNDIEDFRINIFFEQIKLQHYEFMYFLQKKYQFVKYKSEDVIDNIFFPVTSVLRKKDIVQTDLENNILFLIDFILLIKLSNTEDSQIRLENLIDSLDKITIDYNEFFMEITEDKTILDYYLIPTILFSLRQLHSLLSDL